MNCLIIVGQEIEYTGDSLVSSRDDLNIERVLSWFRDAGKFLSLYITLLFHLDSRNSL